MKSEIEMKGAMKRCKVRRRDEKIKSHMKSEVKGGLKMCQAKLGVVSFWRGKVKKSVSCSE